MLDWIFDPDGKGRAVIPYFGMVDLDGNVRYLDINLLNKFNRRRTQEKKPHRQVVHKPMGLPAWERPKPRKRRDKEVAVLTKKVRGKGLPKRK